MAVAFMLFAFIGCGAGAEFSPELPPVRTAQPSVSGSLATATPAALPEPVASSEPVAAPEPVVETVEPEPKPAVTVETLGYSRQGVAIRMHTFGRSGPTTLIFGGIHGNEPASKAVAVALVKHLTAEPSLYRGRRVAVIPAANPDGLKAGTRTNANGVDCNRNFPTRNWRPGRKRSVVYGGPAAASEPETRLIIQAVNNLSPVQVIALHSITAGRECNNYDGPARSLAQLLSRHNGYKVSSDIGYPTPGSFGTWAGEERNIASITLELPRGIDGDKAWDTNRLALISAIQREDSARGDDDLATAADDSQPVSPASE
ncbi:MAG: M14 family murein peptide amidase A [Phycisphaerae bacterium]